MGDRCRAAGSRLSKCATPQVDAPQTYPLVSRHEERVNFGVPFKT